jgi:hypothetical protein
LDFIGTRCFAGTQLLQSCAYSSDSVVHRITEYAFSFSSLTLVSIPRSMEVIEPNSFRGCDALVEVCFDARSRLRRIERNAFLSTGLMTVHLPPSLDFLDGTAFPLRTEVIVDDQSPRFANRRFFLLDLYRGCLIRWTSERPLVEIPSEVCSFGVGSFSLCPIPLEFSFDVPCILSRFEERAFAGSGITEITIPESIEEIGYRCFFRCCSLKSIQFMGDSQLARIGNEAFAHSAITALSIPPRLQVLDPGCWARCLSLSELSFTDCAIEVLHTPATVTALIARSESPFKRLTTLVFD